MEVTSKPISNSPQSSIPCPKCKAPNEPGLFLCSECGHELSASNNGKTLSLVANGRSYRCADGDILGRSGTLAQDFFSAIVTVSRKHISLPFRDGKWYVRVLPGVGNLTQLDGQSLPAGSESLLESEHRLRLSSKCEVILRTR